MIGILDPKTSFHLFCTVPVIWHKQKDRSLATNHLKKVWISNGGLEVHLVNAEDKQLIMVVLYVRIVVGQNLIKN